jgi:hypothetical protein
MGTETLFDLVHAVSPEILREMRMNVLAFPEL